MSIGEKSRVKTQGKFCKRDFLMMYDGISMETFEEWIEDIKEEIKWKPKGKQIFSPKVAQRIIDHIGLPISLNLLNQ